MGSKKTVFFIIGILLMVLGSFMLVPYIIQILYDENSHSFLSSSFITIFFGVLFVLTNLQEEYKLNLQQTFLFSALAWLAVAVFGSKYTRSIKKTFPKFLSSITAHGDFIEALFSLEQARSDVANAAE